METILREKYDDPDYRLCDYFDLIGGTSTGSIIAAGLAIGLTVDELADDYMVLGGKIFGEKRDWWNPLETWKYLQANYDYHALEKSLREVFGEIKLNSDKILTGLCITSKRADTNSTWPLINHPDGKFFDSDLGRNGKWYLYPLISPYEFDDLQTLILHVKMFDRLQLFTCQISSESLFNTHLIPQEWVDVNQL